MATAALLFDYQHRKNSNLALASVHLSFYVHLSFANMKEIANYVDDRDQK
jgi:hypothetical protein